MSSAAAPPPDQRSSSSSSSSSSGGGSGGGGNKPTSDLVQIEKIQRIVQREILQNRRHLFPAGRWPSDGVPDAASHPEPYSTAMRFGGRDPGSKKKAGLTKRPPNMWMIFRMHAASVVMEEFPEVNQAALTSVLAPIWQNVISADEKELVRRESDRLKELHKLQFPEWKYRPRQKKRQNSAADCATPKASERPGNQLFTLATASKSRAQLQQASPRCLPPSPTEVADCVDPLGADCAQWAQVIPISFGGCLAYPLMPQEAGGDKDPVLRSILAAPQPPQAPPPEMSALPDFLPDFADFALPDLDAYLGHDVCDQQQQQQQQQLQLPVKQEFSYAVI